MELAQWIQLFGAISSTAAAREKSKWLIFSGGLVACTVLLLIVIWALMRSLTGPAIIGATALGLLVAVFWLLIQQRLLVECEHWNRLLRGIEGQFAGTELHRSIHRLLLGEEVCVAGSAWVCGEWHPEGVRFPILSRRFTSRIVMWVPGVYALAFVALLVGILVY
jgi:hypothetical protein